MKNNDFIYLGLFTLVMLLVSSCVTNTENKYLYSPQWTLVYKNSQEGESLFGSKKDLINALRSGSPLRIGFGGRNANDTLKTIEHIADANFTNIVNGKEVFAQIEHYNGQRLDLDEVPLNMVFREDRKFTMLAGTNGKLSILRIDFEGDTVRTTTNKTRGFSWYVQQISSTEDYDDGQPIEPLW